MGTTATMAFYKKTNLPFGMAYTHLLSLYLQSDGYPDKSGTPYKMIFYLDKTWFNPIEWSRVYQEAGLDDGYANGIEDALLMLVAKFKKGPYGLYLSSAKFEDDIQNIPSDHMKQQRIIGENLFKFPDSITDYTYIFFFSKAAPQCADFYIYRKDYKKGIPFQKPCTPNIEIEDYLENPNRFETQDEGEVEE